MDELFLRNKRNPRGISPFVYRARKRAQGSCRLCNRDYAAAYVEVDRQVRLCISRSLFPCGCSHSPSNTRGAVELRYCAATENYAKIMCELCNSRVREMVRRQTPPAGAFSQFYSTYSILYISSAISQIHLKKKIYIYTNRSILFTRNLSSLSLICMMRVCEVRDWRNRDAAHFIMRFKSCIKISCYTRCTMSNAGSPTYVGDAAAIVADCWVT